MLVLNNVGFNKCILLINNLISQSRFILVCSLFKIKFPNGENEFQNLLYSSELALVQHCRFKFVVGCKKWAGVLNYVVHTFSKEILKLNMHGLIVPNKTDL